MRTWETLRSELCDILGSDHVYYQPPESFKMVYPCIVINLSSADHKWSGDGLYFYENRYELIYMTKDSESTLREDIVRHFRMCQFDRHYVVDNLYHDIFTIFW